MADVELALVALVAACLRKPNRASNRTASRHRRIFALALAARLLGPLLLVVLTATLLAASLVDSCSIGLPANAKSAARFTELRQLKPLPTTPR